jgi:hypothetical protein
VKDVKSKAVIAVASAIETQKEVFVDSKTPLKPPAPAQASNEKTSQVKETKPAAVEVRSTRSSSVEQVKKRGSTPVKKQAAPSVRKTLQQSFDVVQTVVPTPQKSILKNSNPKQETVTKSVVPSQQASPNKNKESIKKSVPQQASPNKNKETVKKSIPQKPTNQSQNTTTSTPITTVPSPQPQYQPPQPQYQPVQTQYQAPPVDTSNIYSVQQSDFVHNYYIPPTTTTTTISAPPPITIPTAQSDFYAMTSSRPVTERVTYNNIPQQQQQFQNSDNNSRNSYYQNQTPTQAISQSFYQSPANNNVNTANSYYQYPSSVNTNSTAQTMTSPMQGHATSVSIYQSPVNANTSSSNYNNSYYQYPSSANTTTNSTVMTPQTITSPVQYRIASEQLANSNYYNATAPLMQQQSNQTYTDSLLTQAYQLVSQHNAEALKPRPTVTTTTITKRYPDESSQSVTYNEDLQPTNITTKTRQPAQRYSNESSNGAIYYNGPQASTITTTTRQPVQYEYEFVKPSSSTVKKSDPILTQEVYTPSPIPNKYNSRFSQDMYSPSSVLSKDLETPARRAISVSNLTPYNKLDSVSSAATLSYTKTYNQPSDELSMSMSTPSKSSPVKLYVREHDAEYEEIKDVNVSGFLKIDPVLSKYVKRHKDSSSSSSLRAMSSSGKLAEANSMGSSISSNQTTSSIATPKKNLYETSLKSSAPSKPKAAKMSDIEAKALIDKYYKPAERLKTEPSPSATSTGLSFYPMSTKNILGSAFAKAEDKLDFSKSYGNISSAKKQSDADTNDLAGRSTALGFPSTSKYANSNESYISDSYQTPTKSPNKSETRAYASFFNNDSPSRSATTNTDKEDLVVSLAQQKYDELDEKYRKAMVRSILLQCKLEAKSTCV